MTNFEELQRLAQNHKAEQHVISVMQKHMHRPKRPAPAPPVPMAPLAGKTIAEALTTLDPVAVKLFVLLSQAETDDFGIVRIERRELADLMGKGVSTVAQASAQLRAAGLVQRHGRKGYLIRKK